MKVNLEDVLTVLHGLVRAEGEHQAQIEAEKVRKEIRKTLSVQSENRSQKVEADIQEICQLDTIMDRLQLEIRRIEICQGPLSAPAKKAFDKIMTGLQKQRQLLVAGKNNH